MSRDSFASIACRMDKWIGLATRNNIRELEIIFIRELENILRGTETNGLSYSLPDTVYVAKSLLSLTLWNCVLRKPLLCSCLQNLKLENVSLCHDNIIQNILLNTPLLERFILGGCSGVNNIRLCNLPRLVSVSTRGVSKVKIEAPNLQSLCYSWNDGPSGLEVIACNMLKKLHIRALMTSQSIQELISRFPFIETLYLSLGGLSRLKTCNTQLKHLNLQSDFEELEIDTANLSSYIYGGQAIPSHVSLKNSSLQDVSITLNLYSFDTQWFFKLRKHLANFKQIDCLRLNVCADMTSPSTQGSLNLLQLSHECISPPSKLKYLKIVFCRTSRVHCIALIDALLWSSRPNKLRL